MAKDVKKKKSKDNIEQVEELVQEKVDEIVEDRVDEIVEELVVSNENVEKGLEIIEKQVDEIEELQEELVKEKCENVELKTEIEREKTENEELIKENKKLRMSISFLRLVFFFVFTVIVFVGGWYIGTKLVDLDKFLYGDDEVINPEEDKDISFSKKDANVELDKFFGDVMSKKGFIAKVLNKEDVPDEIDLYNVYQYRLSVVPRFDAKLYEDSMYPYVTYDSFKKAYKQIYNLENLEEIFNGMEGYPMLVDGNKVVFDDYLTTGVVVKFSADEIKYTAKDKIYTMTGTYQETAGMYSILYGTSLTGSFELKYKMDDVGNKHIVGMVIFKEDMTLSQSGI